MGKQDFCISLVSKKMAGNILNKYHYLSGISKGFKSGFNYGLFKDNVLVGVCIYTGFPVPELSQGMLGLKREDQVGLFELSRLVITPDIQKDEHNIASWFVSRTLKALRLVTDARVVLSYADSSYHSGVIYKACNFKYYGLTDAKSDFFIHSNNGELIKHSRGSIKGVKGEWMPRSRKHRFVIVFDSDLTMKWDEGQWMKPLVRVETKSSLIINDNQMELF